MKKLLFVALLFSAGIVRAQGGEETPELPEITPPSPTAYELGKYGQNQIGLFSGAAQLNIPLYTYRAGNLSVPISLGYSSNGIQVDQVSSNVGLGWSLNAGGVITRVIRDEPDEQYGTFFPEEEIQQAGVRSPMALDYFYAAGNDQFDTETDLFMYNVAGYSGKFVFDNDKNIVLIPHSNVVIESYVEGLQNGFRLTAPDGIVYIFLEEEINIQRSDSESGSHTTPSLPNTTSWYLSSIEHPYGDVISFTYTSQNYDYTNGVSQSLTVSQPWIPMVCPSGSSSVPVSKTEKINNHLFVVGKQLTGISSNRTSSGSVSFIAATDHPQIAGLDLVTQISVQDAYQNEIERFDLSYLFTANNRVFLNGITYKDPDKSYAFTYEDPEGLVSRLSYSQDHWGYYNGKSNTEFFPDPNTLEIPAPYGMQLYNGGADKATDTVYAKKGLLKQVHYPTKGYSEFEYEGNSYLGTNYIYPPSQEVRLKLVTTSEDFGFFTDSHLMTNITFNQSIPLFKNILFNEDACDPTLDTGHTAMTIRVNNGGEFIENTLNGPITLGSSIVVKPTDNDPNINLSVKAGIDYLVEIEVIRPCTFGSLTFSYYQGNIQEIPANKLAGGMRVKRVTDYDGSGTAQITRYYYGQKETKEVSSGEKGLEAYYISNITNRVACAIPCAYVDQTYKVLNSKSLRTLYNPSGNGTTTYKYVTISHGGDQFENGGEEHEFIIHNDYPGNPLFGNPVESSPWVNAGWSNGLPKKTTVFTMGSGGSFVPLRETINTYNEDARNFNKVYGYSIVKKFDLICASPDITYECTAADLTKTYEYQTCVTDHKHFWAALPFDGIDSWRCIASGSNNQTIHTPHPCFGKTVGYIVSKPEYLENLDIMEYSTNSYWHYLSSTTEKVYDETGQNPVETITNYTYDNPTHLQATRVATTNSLEESRIEQRYYPHDKAQLSGLSSDAATAIDSLVAQHRITELLQGETYEDTNTDGTPDPGELLTARRTNYKLQPSGLTLPGELQTLVGPESATNTLDTRIRYQSYDHWGNVREVAKEGGGTIVYIWGYNHQYPIAKIEGATYTEVSSLVANLESLSDADTDRHRGSTGTEGALRDALNNLRTQLPDALVSTYTYDPLIGLTSTTDPSGYTMYYEYDSFNRLTAIRDDQGKLLSENQYHYKNQ